MSGFWISRVIIEFHWQLEITNSRSWNLIRKFDILSEKQITMRKTQILWWKTTKKCQKIYIKVLSNIFLWTSHTDPWCKMLQNFREKEEIYWYYFVRRTHSYTGFAYFYKCDRVLNTRRDAITEPKYSKILSTPGFYICEIFIRFRICLNNAWINFSDYGRVLNVSDQRFTRFWYTSGSKYARG